MKGNASVWLGLEVGGEGGGLSFHYEIDNVYLQRIRLIQGKQICHIRGVMFDLLAIPHCIVHRRHIS